jgi:hypothetical protein
MMDSHHGNESVLFRIDGPTGEVLEELPILGGDSIGRGLALRWDGMLFTVEITASDRLFRIDPATGQGEAIGEPLPPGGVVTLAADPSTGRLYCTNSINELFQVDHTTGEATRIGMIFGPFPMATAMAIGRDGMGYVTDMGNVALYRFDLATAQTEFVCYLGSGQFFQDLAFDDAGQLWGAFGAEGMVRRHDPQTCAGEVLYDGWYVTGIEVVPEGSDCYPDCNGDGSLDLFDFLCFVNAFNDQDESGECTGDGQFDLFDFLCFTNNFNAGC